jgi:hypothetical protein
MKFRMINLGYRATPDYPYDYRIELVEYGIEEREQLGNWLKEQKIPHTTAGLNTSSVLYMRKREAMWFAMRWS